MTNVDVKVFRYIVYIVNVILLIYGCIYKNPKICIIQNNQFMPLILNPNVIVF